MSDQARTNTRPQARRTYPPGYGIVEPVANYRPWDVDDVFQEVYRLVRDATMVDIYRLWTLWFIASQVPAGDVLEVGSWRGGSGVVIARALERPRGGITSAGRETAGRETAGRDVFLADTFAGVVKASTRDTYYKGGEHANTSVELVRGLLERAGVPHVRLLPGVFPDDRGHEIEERSFALCHIDVDVYQSARETFEWVWPRMVSGGVVVFDDFGFYGCEGVTGLIGEIAGRPDGSGGRLTVIPSLSGQAMITHPGY